MNALRSQVLWVRTFQNESTFVLFALCNTREVIDIDYVHSVHEDSGILMLQGGACLTRLFCFIFGGCGGSLTTATGTFSSPN